MDYVKGYRITGRYGLKASAFKNDGIFIDNDAQNTSMYMDFSLEVGFQRDYGIHADFSLQHYIIET